MSSLQTLIIKYKRQLNQSQNFIIKLLSLKYFSRRFQQKQTMSPNIPNFYSSQQMFNQISKDTFMKYKKVRKIQTQLMGQHYLFSKDSVKYLVKQLPKNVQFISTRPFGSILYHKYTSPNSNVSSYIYPIFGCSLESVVRASTINRTVSNSKNTLTDSKINQTEQSKQYQNLLSRHKNCPQKVYNHILKFLLKYTLPQQHYLRELSNSGIIQQKKRNNQIIPLYLQCVRVYNGELLYCYDSWINSQTSIVLSNIREIQNLHLSQSQLERIGSIYHENIQKKNLGKQILIQSGEQNQTISFGQRFNKEKLLMQNNYQNYQSKSNKKCQTNNQNNYSYSQQQVNSPAKLSFYQIVYKSSLLIIYLGSLQLNLRLYEWGQFKINYNNLQKRFNHFKFKINYNQIKQKKFVDLLEKILFKHVKQSELKIQHIYSLIFQQDKKDDQRSSIGSKSEARSSFVKAPTRLTQVKKISNMKANNQNAFYQSRISQNGTNYKLSNSSAIKKQPKPKSNLNNLEHIILKQSNSQPIFQEFTNQYNQKPLTDGFFSKIPLVSSQTSHPQRIQIQDRIKNDFFQDQNQNIKSSKKVVKFKKNITNDQNLNSSTGNSCQFMKQNDKNDKKSLQKKQNPILGIRYSIQASLQDSFSQINDQTLNSGSNIKLLKLLNLQEYIPTNKYQQNIIKHLSDVFIKKSFYKKQYEDNSLYLGEILSSQNNNLSSPIVRHGKGLYLFPSNDIYYGDWSHNSMGGRGVYIFKSGEVYDGELKKGRKEGYGKFDYSDSRSYLGFWKNDQKVGLGTVLFYNNRASNKNSINSHEDYEVKFVGLFRQNQSDDQVQGIFTGYDTKKQQIWSKQGILAQYDHQKKRFSKRNVNSSDASKLNKKLLQCSASKYHTQTDQKGSSYQGQFQNNQKNGFGIQQDSDTIFQGNFLNNQRDGKGVLHVKQRFNIQGQWKNGFLVQYNFNVTLS